jgi:hypothetical protein
MAARRRRRQQRRTGPLTAVPGGRPRPVAFLRPSPHPREAGGSAAAAEHALRGVHGCHSRSARFWNPFTMLFTRMPCHARGSPGIRLLPALDLPPSPPGRWRRAGSPVAARNHALAAPTPARRSTAKVQRRWVAPVPPPLPALHAGARRRARMSAGPSAAARGLARGTDHEVGPPVALGTSFFSVFAGARGLKRPGGLPCLLGMRIWRRRGRAAGGGARGGGRRAAGGGAMFTAAAAGPPGAARARLHARRQGQPRAVS